MGKLAYLLRKRIQERLKALGMAQKELAQRVEIHQPTISNWVNDKREPPNIEINTLEKLGEALGTDPWLLIKPEGPPVFTDADRAFLHGLAMGIASKIVAEIVEGLGKPPYSIPQTQTFLHSNKPDKS